MYVIDVMGFGNFFVICFLIYYSFIVVGLLQSQKRKGTQQTNIRLEQLRRIAVKNMDEQKEFLELKYPKKPKYKFSWSHVPKFILFLFSAIILYMTFNFCFKSLGIDLPLWVGLTIVIVAPIIINYILGKYNLEGNDVLLVILGRRKKEK